MTSLRQAAACLGLAGEFSVVRDFLGYREIRFAIEVSLLAQIRLLREPHVHLNCIRVGGELFSENVESNIDWGIYELRRIYAMARVGVGRVKHYALSLEEANGAEIIGSHEEGGELMQKWSAPNDGIDLFLVIDIEFAALGFSPIGGTCDKEERWSGVVLDADYPLLGRTLAHEIGHYLGLGHLNVEGNVMYESELHSGPTLTQAQAERMRSHCMIRRCT